MNKEEKYVLFHKNYANREKLVSILTNDFDGDGNLTLSVEYDTQYTNGEGQHGNAMVNLADTLNVYNYSSLNELVDDLKTRYEQDDKAWQKIVAEMKDKGLEVWDDENESSENENGFYMTDL